MIDRYVLSPLWLSFAAQSTDIHERWFASAKNHVLHRTNRRVEDGNVLISLTRWDLWQPQHFTQPSLKTSTTDQIIKQLPPLPSSETLFSTPRTKQGKQHSSVMIYFTSRVD